MLRTPLRPEESFSDDPLRMMRAARFIAGYGLEPRPRPCAPRSATWPRRLEIVSVERVRDELDKLLRRRGSVAGLWFLVDTGLVDEFLPELPAMRLEQDPIHRHKDVLAHTIAVVAKTRPTVDGRPTKCAWPRCSTTWASPRRARSATKGVSFHHHEVVGARMARDRMQALRYSNETSTTSHSSSTSTCGSTPTAWGGPTARCGGSSATRATCSTS